METLVNEENALYEIQRSLGRIEGALQQSKDEIRLGLAGLREELAFHKQEDQKNFSSMRVAINERAVQREKHLGEQDQRMGRMDLSLQKLEMQDENARKIGVYIVGAFGSLVAFVGAVVIAWFNGYLKIKP